MLELNLETPEILVATVMQVIPSRHRLEYTTIKQLEEEEWQIADRAIRQELQKLAESTKPIPCVVTSTVLSGADYVEYRGVSVTLVSPEHLRKLKQDSALCGRQLASLRSEISDKSKRIQELEQTIIEKQATIDQPLMSIIIQRLTQLIKRT